MAQEEPLPLVPATVITLNGSSVRPMRRATVPTRSSPMSMLAGWICSNKKASRPATGFGIVACVNSSSVFDDLSVHQLGQQTGQAVAHFAPVDDEIDGTLLQQELGALEAFRQFLAHGLLDDAGPAKPISALGSPTLMSPSMARLAETPPMVGSVSTEMKGRPALVRRSGAALVFAICIRENRASCHPRTTGGGEADQAAALLDALLDGAHKAGTDHGGHGAPMKENSNEQATTGTP